MHVWCNKISDEYSAAFDGKTTGDYVGMTTWWETFDSHLAIDSSTWSHLSVLLPDYLEGDTIKPKWDSNVVSANVMLADTATKLFVIDADANANVTIEPIAGKFDVAVTMFDPTTSAFEIERVKDVTSATTIDLAKFAGHPDTTVQMVLTATNLVTEPLGLEDPATWVEIEKPKYTTYSQVHTHDALVTFTPK